MRKRASRTWQGEHFKKMGKFSRDKGCREERALVQHLVELGYADVKRVPLSGAARGFKFDVLGTRDGKEQSFELKTKADGFRWLYDFLARTGLYRFSFGSVCVSLGDNPKEVEKTGGFDQTFRLLPEDHPEAKCIRRILKLQDLKKGADFLVVKSNNRKRIYVKYWP